MSYYISGNGPITRAKVKELLDAHGDWTQQDHRDREYPELSYVTYHNASGKQIGRSEIDGEGDRTYNIEKP